MTVVHVVPVADVIAHDDEGVDCICGPDVEYLIGREGRHGKLITHHSLDGREMYEAYGTAH
jgi:hypothetical protein